MTPSQPIATLVATDHVWVRVAVPVDQLDHVAIPGINAEQGAGADIHQDLGPRTLTRRGQVVQLLGNLEERGRLAQLLIQVNDPLNLPDDTAMETVDDGEAPDQEVSSTIEGTQVRVSPRGVPLFLGAYVEVTIEGQRRAPLIAIPRKAVHDSDRVYVFDDGSLDVRELDIVWRRDDTVLVKGGVRDGEHVIVSTLASPHAGMPLRREADHPPMHDNPDSKTALRVEGLHE